MNKKINPNSTINLSRRNILKTMAAGLVVTATAGVFAWLPSAHATGSNAINTSATGAKVLIVYYSRSGNTRNMAQQIQAKTGGAIAELETVEAYPEAYRATTEQAKKELESGYLPALTTTIENVASYDVIFVGSPNWWGTFAPPVRTFLSEYDLSGKTVVPFITHEGSGMGHSVTDLKSLCPNATILEGLAVRGGRVKNSQTEIAQWLNTIKIW